MKTKIYYLSVILLTFVMSGCFKDKGNYDNAAYEKFTFEGINESYKAISNVDEVVITPTVKSSIPGAEFTYMWEIYETNVQGYAPKLEPICDTKDLKYAVTKDAKTWILVFRATNTKTGYSDTFETSLEVATVTTRGWYVAKDDGVNSDIDLFLTPENINDVDQTPLSDVLLKFNGRQPKGRALKVSMGAAYRILNAEGTKYVNTRSMAVVSENDVFMLPISTMKVARDITTISYSELDVYKPQCMLIFANFDKFMINDGQLYGHSNMSANVGRFGAAMLYDQHATPYRLSKYLVANGSSFIFYDDMNSSFIDMVNSSPALYLNHASKSDTSPLNVVNTNLECLYFGTKDTGSKPVCYGVFKDKTSGKKGIYRYDAQSGKASSFSLVAPLTSADKAFSASLYTMLQDDQFMHFEVDGKIWSRNLSNQFEKEEYTIPAGEKIAFIKNMKSGSGELSEYTFNYIVVGTNINGNYKIRMFKKNAGSFDGGVVAEFSGKGNCADIIYISPKATSSDTPVY